MRSEEYRIQNTEKSTSQITQFLQINSVIWEGGNKRDLCSYQPNIIIFQSRSVIDILDYQVSLNIDWVSDDTKKFVMGRQKKQACQNIDNQ